MQRLRCCRGKQAEQSEQGDSFDHAIPTRAPLYKRVAQLAKERHFVRAATVGLFCGVFSAFLKIANDPAYVFELTFMGKDFLAHLLPDGFVFNCFIVAISIVASFRTAFALSRFADGATCMHQMGSNLFECASSLFAFTRHSKADDFEVRTFQETLVRLLSLMHSFCLEDLEEAAEVGGRGYAYELIDPEPLDFWFQEQCLYQVDTRVEFVFQTIQALMVDGMNSGIINIAPPLLARSFNELGTGLVKYHDGMKVVSEKTPLAYSIITACILASASCFVPLMLATATRGVIGSFAVTFGFVFAVWFIYGIADSLDNPYRKASNTLDAPRAQKDLNEQLLKLLHVRNFEVPKVNMKLLDKNKKSFRLRTRTLSTWKTMAKEKRMGIESPPDEDLTKLGTLMSFGRMDMDDDQLDSQMEGQIEVTPFCTESKMAEMFASQDTKDTSSLVTSPLPAVYGPPSLPGTPVQPNSRAKGRTASAPEISTSGAVPFASEDASARTAMRKSTSDLLSHQKGKQKTWAAGQPDDGSPQSKPTSPAARLRQIAADFEQSSTPAPPTYPGCGKVATPDAQPPGLGRGNSRGGGGGL